jgi:hypothetical protein
MAGGKATMNNRTVLSIAYALGCVGLLLVVGCFGGTELSPTSDANTTLVPIQTPQVPLEDVPIPVGFDLDENRSRYFAPGNTRFVDYFFKGSMDRSQVAAFYRQEMTYAGWELIDERTSEDSMVIMDFDNGTEKCNITLSQSSNLFKPTQLHIALWTAR